MKKEEFKNFVKKNPQFVKYVQNDKMTWQKFFEIYDLYGEDNSIWNSFKDTDTTKSVTSGGIIGTIKELFELFKGVDLNTVQKTLSSLDKAIEAFKGFNTKNNINTNNYEERPKYKYFED